MTRAKGTQIAGPMWNGPLHDQAFLEKLLQHVDSNSDHYGTYTRMKGMLTVAKEVSRRSYVGGCL